ncbi:hypothetical protein NB689_003540 [Xanthomonas sacchari]|nr:hypothetical protein [Xanthomonas sacchari]
MNTRIAAGPSAPSASAKNISLDRKPLSSGMPAIDSEAVIASALVTGIQRRRLPSRRMSRVWVSWSMMPAAMNSEALNTAWLRMWNTPATTAIGVDSPNSMVIRPRCEIVEYASRPLRSCWKIANQAPVSRVIAPMPLTV